MKRTIRCLYCREPLQRPIRASRDCGACGRQNVHQDLRVFRTKRTSMRVLEAALKTVAGVAIGLVTWKLLWNPGGMHGYHGVGWAIGLPMLAGLIAWDTLGLITRRHSVLRMEVFWPALAGSFFLAPVLVVGFGFFVLGSDPGAAGPLLLLVGAAAGVLWVTESAKPRPRRRR